MGNISSSFCNVAAIGMTLPEARDLLRKVISEVKTRYLINLPDYHVRYVDKDGIHDVADDAEPMVEAE